MNSIRLWRGLVTIFLAVFIGFVALSSVIEQWRGVIDFSLGTTSVLIESGDKYTSVYNTSDELVEAHMTLGEQIGAEGSVLLKNINNALPLTQSTPKVTLLGMGSQYPFLGGLQGSSVSNSSQVNLVDALTQKGFDVNPTMIDIYTTLGSVITGTSQGWGGPKPIYGLRPAGFSTPYAPSEPAISAYTDSVDNLGAGADPNFDDSFADYHDAAIVVISRPGAEGSDYYPGAEGIDSSIYGVDSPLALVNNEIALLNFAKANFDTVIVLLNSSSTLEIEPIKNDPGIDAIMYVGFPGAFGFLGVADLLNGTLSPSGHLTDTYAVDTAMSPAMQNFGRIELSDLSHIIAPESLMGQLPATSPLGSFGGAASLAANYYLIQAEGIYTGYKYYETRYYDSIVDAGSASSAVGASNGSSAWIYEDEVSYDFGFGLSYTTFDQTFDSINVDLNDKTITATVTVTNIGSYSGKFVSQLYVQVPYTQHDKDHLVEKSSIQFLGMEKTRTLAPNESQVLTIIVDAKYLASWDSSAKDGLGGWILDGGDYYFALGNGAHDAVNNVLKKQGYNEPGDASLVQVKKIGNSGTVDETTFAQSENGTDVINQLSDADINYYKEGYATYLSRSDWAGTFPRTYNDLTIGGSKVAEWVANLANENYMIHENGNVMNIDGSDGTLKLSDMAGIADIHDIRWALLVNQIPVDVLIAKIAKGGSTTDVIEEVDNPLIYQNDGPNGFSSTLSSRGLNLDDPNANFHMATNAAAAVLAGTFNKELALAWGELMGNDGLWSGNYIIWGAAANLHRTPYNGRNHEYYSEDSMLSNYMAAETVAGALKFGVLVGPKHFAFNDQETQRSGVAPYMTEQKAREGELRAFQGLFEDAGALATMTSFTRIGATAVNNSTNLLVNILRNEWGFNGIVSTDMMNNAGYFRPEMGIMAGITMYADFSRGETMTEVQATWPYLTMDIIEKDETLVNAARLAMQYQLYAFSQSALINVKTINVTPWWETALNIVKYTSLSLAAVTLVPYVLIVVKTKKEVL